MAKGEAPCCTHERHLLHAGMLMRCAAGITNCCCSIAPAATDIAHADAAAALS
jgi:hypothetical protein